MNSYEPVDPKIYNESELKHAIHLLELLLDECKVGKLHQNAAPALLIAIDCINEQLNR